MNDQVLRDATLAANTLTYDQMVEMFDGLELTNDALRQWAAANVQRRVLPGDVLEFHDRATGKHFRGPVPGYVAAQLNRATFRVVR